MVKPYFLQAFWIDLFTKFVLENRFWKRCFEHLLWTFFFFGEIPKTDVFVQLVFWLFSAAFLICSPSCLTICLEDLFRRLLFWALCWWFLLWTLLWDVFVGDFCVDFCWDVFCLTWFLGLGFWTWCLDLMEASWGDYTLHMCSDGCVLVTIRHGKVLCAVGGSTSKPSDHATPHIPRCHLGQAHSLFLSLPCPPCCVLAWLPPCCCRHWFGGEVGSSYLLPKPQTPNKFGVWEGSCPTLPNPKQGSDSFVFFHFFSFAFFFRFSFFLFFWGLSWGRPRGRRLSGFTWRTQRLKPWVYMKNSTYTYVELRRQSCKRPELKKKKKSTWKSSIADTEGPKREVCARGKDGDLGLHECGPMLDKVEISFFFQLCEGTLVQRQFSGTISGSDKKSEEKRSEKDLNLHDCGNHLFKNVHDLPDNIISEKENLPIDQLQKRCR